MCSPANISPTPTPALCAVAVGLNRGKGLSAAARDADWRATTTLKLGSERRVVGVARRLFADQARVVRERLPAALGKMELVAEQLLDIAFWEAEIERRFGPAVLAVVRDGWRTGGLRVAVSGRTFVADSPRVLSIAQEVVGQTKNINAETIETVARIIRDGIEGGLSVDDVGRSLERQFREWQAGRPGRQSRAQLIARTASTPAFEAGQQEAFQDAGVTEHAWLSSRLPETRAAHLAADGQQVMLGQTFLVNNEPMRYPGDPNGSPGNVINCLCSSAPVV